MGSNMKKNYQELITFSIYLSFHINLFYLYLPFLPLAKCEMYLKNK